MTYLLELDIKDMSLFKGEMDSPRALSPSSASEESPPVPSPGSQSPQAPPLPAVDRDASDDAAFQPSSPDVPSASAALKTPKPQSWRRWTAPDRTVAASLEDVESADLAVHLYNTHHLKRRLRHPVQQVDGSRDWQTRDAWLKKGKELKYRDTLTGDWETELMPPKQWSAWPLPPHRLRKESLATGGTEHNRSEWYIGSPVHRDSGDIIRDELLALSLRTAKETWMTRQADSLDVETPDAGIKERSLCYRHPDVEMTELSVIAKGNKSKKEIQSSKTTLLDSFAYSSETEGEQLARRIDSLGVDTETERIASTTDRSDNEHDPESQRTISGTQQPETEAKFLADDALARRILDPSINSLLTNIDRLAMAVQRNRLNHIGDGAHGRSGSTSDLLTDTEPTEPQPRIPSRCQNNGRTRNQRDHFLPKTESASQKGSSVSRRNVDMRSDEECQFKLTDKAQNERTRSTSSASSRASNSSSNSQAGRAAGLMDWSELLGVAAVSGWNQNVVARTAERCASLFDEGMSFRTFGEGWAGKGGPVYIADTAGSVGEMGLDDTAVRKRPYFTPGSLRCPHSECPGSLRDHSGSNRVIDHVRRKHGYDPRTNDSDNEERTFGGVHIDGYLQPVWAKPGWLGHGRAKSEGVNPEVKLGRRKRQKTETGSAITSAHHTQDEGQEAQEAQEVDVVGGRASVLISARLDSVSQRLKPNQACTNCRRRKKPCDGGHPCGRCRRMGDEGTCVAKVAVSRPCTNCKRSRKRCDLGRPCGRCLQRGEEDMCEDVG